MIDSQAITKVNRGWKNPPCVLGLGQCYRQGERDQWAGIVALALGIWAVIPVLLVMFI